MKKDTSRKFYRKLSSAKKHPGADDCIAAVLEPEVIEDEKDAVSPKAKKPRMVSDSSSKPSAIIITEDISNGQEPIPIRVVNETGDGDVLPENFKYINRYVMRDVRVWNMDKEDMYGKNVCCTCEDECLKGICECSKVNLFKQFFYGKDGRLLDTGGTIRECSHLCSCNPNKCRNRVVQKGINKKLEVFKTKEKGWGLRTLEKLKMGDFVCEYFGELLTENLCHLRGCLYKDADAYLLSPVIDQEDILFSEDHVDWPEPLEEYKVASYAEQKTPLDFFKRDKFAIIKASMDSKTSEKRINDEIERQYRTNMDVYDEKYKKEVDDANAEITKLMQNEATFCESLIPKEVFCAKTDQRVVPQEEETAEFLTARFELYKDGESLMKLKNSVSALVQLSHLPQQLQVELRNMLLEKHGLYDEYGTHENEDDSDSVVSIIEDKALSFESIPEDELTFEQQRVKKEREDFNLIAKFEQKICVDPLLHGSVARFLNHSCAPNCCKVVATAGQMMSWKLNDKIVHKPFTRLALFANKDIDPMEELTWDYGYETSGRLK